MSVVFQFGKLWFQKDLVFGWCIGIEGGGFTPLSSVADEWLSVVERIDFPVYVPIDFKQEVLKEISQRNMTKEKIAVRLNKAYDVKAKVEDEPSFNNITQLPRHEDKIKLMGNILSAMVTDITGGISADLGYLIIRKYFGGDNYTIVINKKKVASFENVDDLVEFILRRWW